MICNHRSCCHVSTVHQSNITKRLVPGRNSVCQLFHLKWTYGVMICGITGWCVWEFTQCSNSIIPWQQWSSTRPLMEHLMKSVQTQIVRNCGCVAQKGLMVKLKSCSLSFTSVIQLGFGNSFLPENVVSLESEISESINNWAVEFFQYFHEWKCSSLYHEVDGHIIFPLGFGLFNLWYWEKVLKVDVNVCLFGLWW